MTFPPDRPHGRSVQIATVDNPLVLEAGESLGPVHVEYETWGELDADANNAVLVCHALTGNAHAARHTPDDDPGWWDGLIGPGKAFDTRRYFVLCANILGSCYGTTGPTSTNPRTGAQYGPAFPAISVRDMVTVQHTLLRHLGVKRLAAVAGGSLGGMQVLEWALIHPAMVSAAIPIATASRHSAWCIALNEVSRLAIAVDHAWADGAYTSQPHKGLALARMIAMISYRSRESFEQRFGRRPAGHPPATPWDQGPFTLPDEFSVESYLHYQGAKLVGRFDANSYIVISRAMDHHDVTRGRGTVEEVLSGISVPTLCLGIRSDVLYPPAEQRAIAETIPGAQYVELNSPHGHDAFLIEFDRMNEILGTFLEDAEKRTGGHATGRPTPAGVHAHRRNH